MDKNEGAERQANESTETSEAQIAIELETCTISWTRDSPVPPSIFLSLPTWLDMRRTKEKWVLVLTLKHADNIAMLAATVPVESFLDVPDSRLSAALKLTSFGVGKSALAPLPPRTDQPPIEDEEAPVPRASPRPLAVAIEGCTAIICVRIKGLPSSYDTMGAWSGMKPSEKLHQHLSMLDCVPPKRSLKKKTPRNVDGELEQEIDATLSKILQTYEVLQKKREFIGCDSEQRQRRLKKLLDEDSTSHGFRLNLTPRIQRVVRKRYPVQPENESREQELIGEAYTHLMEVTNTLLTVRGCDGVHQDAAKNPRLPSAEDVLGQRLVLAADAEANELWCVAADEHKAMLSVATLSASDQNIMAETWFEYSTFLLRALGDAKGRLSFCADCLDEARHALDESLALQLSDINHISALRLRGCIFLEQGRLVEARNALQAVLKAPSTSKGATPSVALDAALLCIVLDVQEDGIGAHDAAVRAATAVADNIPKIYRAVAAFQDAAEYLQRWSLVSTSARALAIVRRALLAANARAHLSAKGHIQMPSILVAQRCVLDAKSVLFVEPARAVDLASLATSTAPSAKAYETLGDAHFNQGRIEEAIDPYKEAIRLCHQRSPVDIVPLALRIKHAKSLLQTRQYDAARDAFIVAANEWQTSSLWLGAGAASLRLGRINEADNFLRLATVRSARNAPPHAWLALLHATEADPCDAETHASQVLDLAMTLGINDASLLRELGNAYFALERYALAEALLRRAVAAEPKKGANAHTRRRLADVLAAQDATEDAIDMYKIALATSEDSNERDDISATLQGLLAAVGRSTGV